ncbi:MAG: hypothetical protein A3C92_02700 [Candidatus Sungbacteria bacterium RIFCSPHIGHO2_02_FULL_53_17]|uniref:Uncharacterized protein n=1 Tax=Candidatus Sungbacteria bacterium RIFCSPHIGHO2_02_FULL_53_17 TaxID=1802275 RepID=A0A1G2KTA8_9BACT|nr:MAG: hypothetical protein A3C92_02700 [Candidatus Sungbacteria bacterium RIFCSPHIGHO2_02_FULL_53_17]
MFSIEIDKKGLLYAFELCAVAGVIAASAHFAAREIVAWSTPAVPEGISFSERLSRLTKILFMLIRPRVIRFFLAMKK